MKKKTISLLLLIQFYLSNHENIINTSCQTLFQPLLIIYLGSYEFNNFFSQILYFKIRTAFIAKLHLSLKVNSSWVVID